MANIALPAPQRRNLALWAFAILGVGLLGLLPLSLIDRGLTASPSAAGTAGGARIAYFEFNLGADTLWLADPRSPATRTRALTVQHAPSYGVIPSLATGRHKVAYNVLPPDTRSPGPASPAQLWVAGLSGGKPTLLAEGVDLLVPAVWTPDDTAVVFRRSGETSQLFRVAIGGSGEELAYESSHSLFPIGYAGDRLAVAEVSENGSLLKLIGPGGEVMQSLPLSQGLTRDWSLSPSGTHLAYLEMTFNGQEVAARAFVMDVATGSRVAAGNPGSDAFNPTWDAEGRLVVGQLRQGALSSAAVIVAANGSSALTAPVRGFDVPLAVDASAGAAVTSFDGNSIVNPGRASLVVVEPTGIRREIASGEVTFLGWITP